MFANKTKKFFRALSPNHQRNMALVDAEIEKIEQVEPFKGSREFDRQMAEIIIGLENVPGDVLEIGTFRGKTSILFARVLEAIGSEKEVVTVDPYIQKFPESDITRQRGMVNTTGNEMKKEYDRFLSNLEKLDVKKHKKHYLMKSQEAAELLEGTLFSFIFIDGDHSEEGVLTDFACCAPLLSPNGIIAFDDVRNASFPGVGNAVNQLIEKKKIRVDHYTYRGLFAKLPQ